MLPELLAQIPAEEPIGLVTADGACDTRGCHAAVAARQASAFVGAPIRPGIRPRPSSLPTRRDGQPWKEATAGARARNDILRATHRLGRLIRRSSSGTHRRSRVKAKMRCLKLLGERLTARDLDRQTTEPHLRTALNRFTQPGTPETQRAP